MPNITLPDGSVRSFDAPVTPADVAMDIGPGLAKAALLAVVDDEEWDVGGGEAKQQSGNGRMNMIKYNNCKTQKQYKQKQIKTIDK